MAAAEPKKGDILLGLLDGGGKKPPLPDAKGEPDGDEASTPETGEPSEAFKTAVGETGLGLDDDQAGALWRAIKECAGSY